MDYFNIIRNAPTLSESSNENEIFISEEDDGLFRIDISQPQFPIIASQRVNGAGGTVILEDPDTQELTTSEGGIFRAANFECQLGVDTHGLKIILSPYI